MKKMIACILTVSFVLTGCTPSFQGIPSLSDFFKTAVDRRIDAVGNAYDGLYQEEVDLFEVTEAFLEGDFAMEDAAAGAVNSAMSAPKAAAQTEDSMPYEPYDWNTEGYNPVRESGFISTASQPFSTFGADVDTATYSNLRRTLFRDNGYGVDSSAIRIEEMINYFSYDYPDAEEGKKFSVTRTLSECPWNADTFLLKIGLRAEEVLPEAGSNIVFLIDTSGSMFDSNKLPLAQKAFNILQEQLGENDRVSIVTYAGGDEVIAEGVPGNDHEAIQAAVNSLVAWGGTNGEGGITKAYEIAEKYFIEGGNNRVILATDGDFNLGVSSEAGLVELIEEKKEGGVMLSCLGFGEGNYMDDKMEALADHGNGNYAYIDCTAEAKKVLSEELWSTLYTVAKDVKFQVEFNPAAVKGYRLIGYENRKMAAEDFADDTKDGGEVGSGQTVTVLYEVVTTDSAYEIPSVSSKYQKDVENGAAGDASDELLTVSIRYKEPDEDESVLEEYPVSMDMLADMDMDTSWAAGVAQFGMLFRDSEYKGSSTYASIYERLSKDPAVFTDDCRAEFLYLVRKVKMNG